MITKEKMNSDKNTLRLSGAGFLFQVIASAVWTLLLSSLIVIGDISTSMTNISNNALQMRASIVVAISYVPYMLFEFVFGFWLLVWGGNIVLP